MPHTAVPDVLSRAVRELATVLPSIEEVADADLAVLDPVIGDARVVALGEATHFVAEFAAIQRRVIRYLAERHGFTVLAYEFGFAEAAALDGWLQGHGSDDDLDLRHGRHARSEATRDRWRWLREHNARGEHPIRFVGLDTPGGGGTLRPVLEPLVAFLELADPDTVDRARTAREISHRFESLSQAGSAPLWAQLPIADRTLLTATLSRLSLRMDALRRVYVERTGESEVDLARRHLDIAMAADHMIAAIHDLLTTGSAPDTSIRDRLMADSMFWHLDRLGRENRVVLVAHNLHIQKTAVEEGAAALTMGSYLAEALGEDYRTIALTHTARRAPAISMTTEDPHGFVVTDDPVAEPPHTGLESALNVAGLGAVTSAFPFGPLRGDPRTAPSSIGAQGTHLPTDVLAAHDAVVNLPTATTTDHVSLY
ncbi:erythromycin esterase family protein [Pseudonocardia sp. KRD291]|uniref:erythromycin esterase family protein n=1 Tax=Pseudonocardia sp. KRD291 TaxID=2792007 RepID=UPI001C4A32FC|nr:erythromycin esterase family protein [Pseudonocardia sp. KRD291]MBW0103606.1 erythromycin esterase family protein [Pseudonocardia sp. KRD291]